MVAAFSDVACAATAEASAVSAVGTVAAASPTVEATSCAAALTADEHVQYVTRPNSNDSVDSAAATKMSAASGRSARYEDDLPHAIGNFECLLSTVEVERLGTCRRLST
jgi:hypothetical protein